MLTYLLYGLFLVACFVLVIAVLLQPGKADAGALFTSSVSSTAFGPRGTQSVLAKITIFAAITFMITALMISFGVGGPRSVMEGGGSPVSPTATPAPAASASPEAEAAPAASPQGAASPAASVAPSPAPTAGSKAPASPANK